MDRTVRATELGEAGPDDWLLVDVRTPGEFRGARIEGSLNAPLGDLAGQARALGERAGGRRIALVCRTGRRAEEARRVLAAGGVDAAGLCVLEGGVEAWERAGLPLRRDADAGMSLERQVRIAAGSLVLVGLALGLLVHTGFLALTGFVGAGLVFAGLTDTCGMGMLLAKMPWNRAPAACEPR